MSWRRRVGLIGLVGLGLSWGGAVQAEDSWPPEGGQILDRLVAIVNQEPVTLFELQRAAAPSLARALRETRDPVLRDAQMQAAVEESLEQLIDDILVYELAQEMHLTADPRRVEEHIREIREANGWTEAEFEQELQKLGFASIADYRRHTEREMLKSQVIGMRVVSSVKVDEAEVEAEYQRRLESQEMIEERRSAHILLRLPREAGVDEVAQAEAILWDAKERIEAGEMSFGDAARSLSQDGTRNAGGDLGWFVRGDYDPTFEAQAFRTPKGEVSEPFRTPFGVHLVTTVDLRERAMDEGLDAEQAKREILYRLREKRIEGRYRQWVQGLRQGAFVQTKSLEMPFF